MKILEVKDVVKVFKTRGGDVRALNGVSLEIDEGKTVGVVGESGSGKTTLGRMIVGLINPNKGSISFEQRSIGSKVNIRHPDIRGKIQLVFQEPSESLDPRIKVGDSICEPLKGLRIEKSEWNSKLENVSKKVGLYGPQLSMYPSQLSAG
ncbi:MAG: putative ABC transporter ATP-binding protein, partial [Alphaproteobacteria bacterium MarineAlpha2_Bin1]